MNVRQIVDYAVFPFTLTDHEPSVRAHSYIKRDEQLMSFFPHLISSHLVIDDRRLQRSP